MFPYIFSGVFTIALCLTGYCLKQLYLKPGYHGRDDFCLTPLFGIFQALWLIPIFLIWAIFFAALSIALLLGKWWA